MYTANSSLAWSADSFQTSLFGPKFILAPTSSAMSKAEFSIPAQSFRLERDDKEEEAQNLNMVLHEILKA